MTCCIAYKSNDSLYFISDTAGTDEDGVQECRMDPKIFLKKRILFATDGSFRMRDVLMYNLDIPPLTKQDKLSPRTYVISKLIPAIRQAFDEHEVYVKNEESDKVNPGNILIGIEDRIFKIECDFQVGEVSNCYNAIGDGSREALGALDMYGRLNNFNYPSKEKDIKELLNKAIGVSAFRNANVNCQCITLSQKYHQITTL